ncbi:MAG: ribose-phosphate diphosphokinase [Candidatus Pacebacteria bacterium]|nr:ribose-phosphate diphosphokinase [Candidatus Paceibacterota bacterium]
MKTFNLDPDFTPYGKSESFEQFTFPSGFEHHVKLPTLEPGEEVRVSTRINSSDDVMKLLLLSDALERMKVVKKELFIPYLPYARQDRMMAQGEPVSLKVIANLINQMGFHQVSILDAHSLGTELCIENYRAIDNSQLVQTVLETQEEYLVISPDAGAYKKIFSLCKNIGYQDGIVSCGKVRNLDTGRIINITTDGTPVEGKELIIVDDICDGGMTFILLAQKLKELGAASVTLIVTHGIFSKGEEQLKKYVDRIYTTDSINNISSEYITRFSIENLYNKQLHNL